MQFSPSLPGSRRNNKQKQDGDWKNHADQAARQHRQPGQRRGAPIRGARIKGSGPPAKKEIKNGGEFQRVKRFWNHEARERKKTPPGAKNPTPVQPPPTTQKPA